MRACFVNLGSDHPSILEAIAKAQKGNGKMPKIYTSPNEMVALAAADGYARLSGQPQCVIVHVDVGTQGLAAAVHDASCGRCPVLIFAGLSPYTIDGEHRGSRTEYIHWIQDVPDQKQIVQQYCRYTGEIKTGRNVKQILRRALQFATSDPQGPVYVYGARESMEMDIEPYSLNEEEWGPIQGAALPEAAVAKVAEALVHAKEPLVITGYVGRKHTAPPELVKLADAIEGLRVLDTGGSDMCFPADHPAWLSLRFGVDESIKTADVILVLDCDVPWIPTQCRPSPTAKIFHIDVDPLKQQMPVFYISAQGRWKADATIALRQLNEHIAKTEALSKQLRSYHGRHTALKKMHAARLADIAKQAETPADGTINTAYLCAQLKRALPADTIYCIEAVTNTQLVADQLRATLPGSWINCGGGGLGWSGGAALGIKLAAEAGHGRSGSRFVCQVVGDGTYLFSVPGSVYWMAARYQIPVLTVVLNNKGWNAPRRSLLLVHPDGDASRATNEELHISFAPTPDYAGIAYAAAGGEVWAGRASTVEELARALPEAIESVKSGRGAVLDAQCGGSEGKFQGYDKVKQRGQGLGEGAGQAGKGYGTGLSGTPGNAGTG